MIEVAKELQKRKPDAELNVFFLDNDPTIIQTSLQQLGEDGDLDVNILRSTLKIHDLKVRSISRLKISYTLQSFQLIFLTC